MSKKPKDRQRAGPLKPGGISILIFVADERSESDLSEDRSTGRLDDLNKESGKKKNRFKQRHPNSEQ
ncbi:MAG TPA: hypothetical protein VE933_07680 [Chitinophagaceae bacterium]|jgi:hypothetical protein|nr:hypothetical protein [Chitinophagaceae bacterium]